MQQYQSYPQAMTGNQVSYLPGSTSGLSQPMKHYPSQLSGPMTSQPQYSFPTSSTAPTPTTSQYPTQYGHTTTSQYPTQYGQTTTSQYPTQYGPTTTSQYPTQYGQTTTSQYPTQYGQTTTSQYPTQYGPTTTSYAPQTSTTLSPNHFGHSSTSHYQGPTTTQQYGKVTPQSSNYTSFPGTTVTSGYRVTNQGSEVLSSGISPTDQTRHLLTKTSSARYQPPGTNQVRGKYQVDLPPIYPGHLVEMFEAPVEVRVSQDFLLKPILQQFEQNRASA